VGVRCDSAPRAFFFVLLQLLDLLLLTKKMQKMHQNFGMSEKSSTFATSNKKQQRYDKETESKSGTRHIVVVHSIGGGCRRYLRMGINSRMWDLQPDSGGGDVYRYEFRRLGSNS